MIKHFHLFLAGRLTVTLAMQSFQVALGWHVYQLTGNALDLGLLGLFQFMPSILLMPLIGQVIDRVDRLLALRVCQGVAATVLGSLALLTFTGQIQRDWVFGLIFVFGCTRAFEGPSQQALLPAMVEQKSGLPRAIASASLMQKIGAISGTALGGLLCAISPGVVYAMGALLFLTSIGLLSAIAAKARLHATPSGSAGRGWHEVFAGFRFVRRHSILLGAMSLDMLATLFGGVLALLPMIAQDVLHLGPSGLGMLRSAPAIGALCMALFLAWRPLRRQVGKILFGSVAVYGLATILFGLSHNVWASLLALWVVGASDMVSVVIRNSLIQLDTPDEMRGRVGAVNFTFVTASNQLGQMESGLTAAWFGVVPAVLIGGVGSLLVAAIWWHGFPRLWRRQTLVESKGYSQLEETRIVKFNSNPG